MDLMNVKCPNCSGSVTFEDGSSFAVCDYCRSKLNFQQELAKFHDENQDELDAISARVIDLIEDANFLQAESAIKDALLKYPYAGRLHVYMLMCEFAVTHPEELAETGKDFTCSNNYQKCLRYMMPEDKKDLMSLVGKMRDALDKNKSTNEKPVVVKEVEKVESPKKVERVVEDKPESSFKKPEFKPVPPIIVEKDEDDDDYEDEPLRQEPPKRPTVQQNKDGVISQNYQSTQAEKQSVPQKKKKMNLGVTIGAVSIGLCICFFITGMVNAICDNNFGNVVLLVTGIIEILAAVILYKVFDYRYKIYCPVCGTKRIHHREWMRTDVSYDYNNKEKETQTYRDTYECPACGELKIETVKKVGDIKEF